MLISYAQNFEDVILMRALRHIPNGRYIDVGAQDPTMDSVSLAFYMQGWRGVHVEPDPNFARELRRARPDEIVLEAALASSKKERTFFSIRGSGLSTLNESVAFRHGASGLVVDRFQVNTMTLDDVFQIACGQDVHWLKVDVEGSEDEVLAGWTSNCRPWIVVVEATHPSSALPSTDWEYRLFAKGYEFVYFDGLNRFYVSQDHPELASVFGAGPNVFDNFALSGTSSSSFCSHILGVRDSVTLALPHSPQLAIATGEAGDLSGLNQVGSSEMDESTSIPSRPSLALDINELLHQGRSALLRQVPKGAHTFLSAGCAGNWFFEWVEACYGRPPQHIGLEAYTPKPNNLPNNVTWIENTCSNMSGVGSQTCDLVFSGQNFEHLWPDELLGFFLESARVCKPGGLIVVDSPNRSITECLGNWSHPEHTIEATTEEAEHLLSLAGFDVVSRKGVWLGRDPATGEILPFVSSGHDRLTASERLILGASSPTDAFIWWFEARRSYREPAREALRKRIDAIFEVAWPERLSRMSTAVGRLVEIDGQRWIEAEEGTTGVLVYGPYAPLRPGNYRCTFWLQATSVASGEPDVVCEVYLQSISGPLCAREIIVSAPDQLIQIEFSLEKLEFGVQFRVISLGRRAFRARMIVDLEDLRHSIVA